MIVPNLNRVMMDRSYDSLPNRVTETPELKVYTTTCVSLRNWVTLCWFNKHEFEQARSWGFKRGCSNLSEGFVIMGVNAASVGVASL